MEHEEITRQTMAAFEDLMTDEERGVEEEEPDLGDAEEELRPAEDDDDREQEETPEEPEEDEEEEEVDEEEEEPEEEVAAERDPEVLAFLAKYDGDLEAALKGGSELYHLINRQGREKNEALERAAQLEAELARARAFSRGQTPLTEEARSWVEEASGSDNPAGYVQMAVDAGQYDLARAVCEEWAHADPYNAARVGFQIDAFEQQAQVDEPMGEPFELSRMLEAARDQFPDMPAYWGQMTRLIGQLGDGHHLVQAARSSDVNEAARGIVGLYDIAKATSVNVREAKEKVKAGKRQEAVDVREKAQVTSAATSPARSQTPRQTMVMPGLTLEDLEAAFAEAE